MAERRMLHSIYKLAFNSFNTHDVFELALVGIPVPHSVVATGLAAKVRLEHSLSDSLLYLDSHRAPFTDMLLVIGLAGWIPNGWSSSSLLSNLIDNHDDDSFSLTQEHQSAIRSLISPPFSPPPLIIPESSDWLIDI